MAKQITPFGGHFVGRLGTAVGAKLKGGDYVARSYQPQVKNPRTLRQQTARKKFSALSGLAALLAEPLNIGYAMAVSGTKMYPRNKVVSDLYNEGAIVLFVGGEIDNIEWNDFPMSKKVGLEGVPSITYTPAAGQTPAHFSCKNADDIVINTAEEELGLVLVCAATTSTGLLSAPIMLTGKASVGIDVPAAKAALLGGCSVFAFFKAMPKTGTEIPTDQWPWKYPSKTGATVLATTIA